MKYFRASPRMSPGSRARAKAKSIALEIEKLSDQCMVMPDFDGINEIGQGLRISFFRVNCKGHPGTKLVTVNCTAAVLKMIARAIDSGYNTHRHNI